MSCFGRRLMSLNLSPSFSHCPKNLSDVTTHPATIGSHPSSRNKMGVRREIAYYSPAENKSQVVVGFILMTVLTLDQDAAAVFSSNVSTFWHDIGCWLVWLCHFLVKMCGSDCTASTWGRLESHHILHPGPTHRNHKKHRGTRTKDLFRFYA